MIRIKTGVILILAITISGHCFGQLPKETNLVRINEIEMYYEVYGAGEPLLLLHGWTQSSAFWSEYIPVFARHFKVYVVDLRGHGRTSQLAADFTIEKSSQDISTFLDHLKLKTVKAIGLSYGGLVLLELAVSNPERIESMVLIGAAQSYHGGENSEISDSFSYENLPISFIKELEKIHYHGESQIKALFDPNINYQINLEDEEVQAIKARCLIVNGDRDEILGIDPAITLHRNLPNSELWIVPNTGHIAITGSNLDSFLKISTQFLMGK